MKSSIVTILSSIFYLISIAQLPYQNTNLSSSERADNLIKQLTIDEKISLLLYNSPGIKRLNIPAYNWWNEALHGVARAGKATVFPQAIALGATFDDDLVYNVANAISDEARAKYNDAISKNIRTQYFGLTFWSPNINIFRDPRWGRGNETYGEDPFLTGTIGSAFVKGMQGSNKEYYKTVACAKHFAVHSGPEPLRHNFNAVVSKTDLYNTYLPAFKKLVTNAKVGGIMCAYNKIDSTPCCINANLLTNILRKDWGFKGYIVTDCWALDDIINFHKYLSTPEEVAALAIKNGINVECGNTLKTLQSALIKKLITENEIDAALKINLETLFKLGWFNPINNQPYKNISASIINNEKHKQLAKNAAINSMVLLSNKNNILPLKKTIKTILVTGPNANETNILLANYNGLSGNLVTVLEGIVNNIDASTAVHYDKGCELTDTTKQQVSWMINDMDVVIAVLGLSPLLEGENGDANLSEAGGDKKDIKFPYAQLKYLKALRAKTNKPIIVVLAAGSAIELAEVEEIADAVLLAWYPGEQGGNAVAEILFGKANPSGKLPITFYKLNSNLSTFEDYSMKERTYRFFSKEVQHPFGFGLSYTSFLFHNLVTQKNKFGYTFNFDVENIGSYDGYETVQLYIKKIIASSNYPNKELKSFKKNYIKANQTKKITLSFSFDDLKYWDENLNDWTIYKGDYEIQIGNSSQDIKLKTTITVN